MRQASCRKLDRANHIKLYPEHDETQEVVACPLRQTYARNASWLDRSLWYTIHLRQRKSPLVAEISAGTLLGIANSH